MADKPLTIAILSGKGGTGKTLVAVNLAAAAKESIYIDCDVEEPNGHLFFKPQDVRVSDVSIKIPIVNQKQCNGCNQCVEFCQFNALAYILKKLIIFEEVCHSCGGCMIICPKKAIAETDKIIGCLRIGQSENVTVLSGILNTGEASGVPIIKSLLRENPCNKELTLIDCPPGSACMVMESIKEADYCILVAEPTIFGAHNLKMVYELTAFFHKPTGVILNKCLQEGADPSLQFCQENHIPILGKILYDEEIGTINSNAFILTRHSKPYQDMFRSLLKQVVQEVQRETVTRS
jgi:MinD superfamily P-loop ATPase